MSFTLAEYNDLANLIDPTIVQRRGAVITVHGMNTYGVWQKKIGTELEDHGLRHVPVDYGYVVFKVVKKKFLDYVTTLIDVAYEDQRSFLQRVRSPISKVPSAIGHSYGSLALGHSLQIRPTMKYQRIIMFGCILPRDFPWDRIHTNGQVDRVLHEMGGEDPWPKFVLRRFIPKSGDAGSHGFSGPPTCVVQRENTWTRHSDLQNMTHYRTAWVPFLLGGEIAD